MRRDVFFSIWVFGLYFSVFLFYSFLILGQEREVFLCFVFSDNFHRQFSPTFFDQTVSCPNFCVSDPKKRWPVGLLFGTTCCVVLCCGACVQDFRGCVHPLRRTAENFALITLNFGGV